MSILTPLYLIEVISFLNLFPLHISHSSSTSAINCISILTIPSPLHSSHLPPSVLNEKNFDLKPLDTDWGIFEYNVLISSYTFKYVTGLEREDLPMGF